jgi:hypothetical protein
LRWHLPSHRAFSFRAKIAHLASRVFSPFPLILLCLPSARVSNTSRPTLAMGDDVYYASRYPRHPVTTRDRFRSTQQYGYDDVEDGDEFEGRGTEFDSFGRLVFCSFLFAGLAKIPPGGKSSVTIKKAPFRRRFQLVGGISANLIQMTECCSDRFQIARDRLSRVGRDCRSRLHRG